MCLTPICLHTLQIDFAIIVWEIYCNFRMIYVFINGSFKNVAVLHKALNDTFFPWFGGGVCEVESCVASFFEIKLSFRSARTAKSSASRCELPQRYSCGACIAKNISPIYVCNSTIILVFTFNSFSDHNNLHFHSFNSNSFCKFEVRLTRPTLQFLFNS